VVHVFNQGYRKDEVWIVIANCSEDVFVFEGRTYPSAQLIHLVLFAAGIIVGADDAEWVGIFTAICALAEYCGFDSLGVDSAGHVVVATVRTGRLTIVDPDDGRWRQIDVGDPHVTNICWGGPELRTAYVTLSGLGKLVAMEWERPGSPLHFLNR
jgi:gluconolactonase